MGDLTTVNRDYGVPTPYLPPRLAGLVRLIGGTVVHPGQKVRHHMAGGVDLTSEDREEARTLLSTLTSALDTTASFENRRPREAKIALVDLLMRGTANGTITEEGAEARFDLFEIALDDVPAWAVAKAIHRWLRREVPEDVERRPNYAFMPSPQTIRAIALLELAPYRRSVADLERLVSAVTLNRAMDPEPLDAPRLSGPRAGAIPQLRKM